LPARHFFEFNSEDGAKAKLGNMELNMRYFILLMLAFSSCTTTHDLVVGQPDASSSDEAKRAPAGGVWLKSILVGNWGVRSGADQGELWYFISQPDGSLLLSSYVGRAMVEVITDKSMTLRFENAIVRGSVYQQNKNQFVDPFTCRVKVTRISDVHLKLESREKLSSICPNYELMVVVN
jgi:hypothetical protein